jgi:hypothetical protein
MKYLTRTVKFINTHENLENYYIYSQGKRKES